MSTKTNPFAKVQAIMVVQAIEGGFRPEKMKEVMTAAEASAMVQIPLQNSEDYYEMPMWVFCESVRKIESIKQFFPDQVGRDGYETMFADEILDLWASMN